MRRPSPFEIYMLIFTAVLWINYFTVNRLEVWCACIFFMVLLIAVDVLDHRK